MPKDWTDAKFEVVDAPPPRKELPRWFRVGLLWLVAIMLMLMGVMRGGGFGDEHTIAPRPDERSEPQAPGAR